MADAKKIAMGIGIAIVLAIFVGYLSYEIGKSGENRCKEKSNVHCCQRNIICEEGVRTCPQPESYYVSSVKDCKGNIVDKSSCESKYIPISSECRDTRNMWFSLSAGIIGLITVIIGIIIIKNGTISGGLIGGGIISMVMALVIYWNRLEGYTRVGVAGVLLVGLIIISWYKLKD